MRYFATWKQAYNYGKRMFRPTGRAFTVQQVEGGLWRGWWFAYPEAS